MGEHDALELGAGVAGVLDDAAALDVAGLVAHKRAALARLDMLELDDGVDLVLDARPRPFLKSAVEMVGIATFLLWAERTSVQITYDRNYTLADGEPAASA